MAAATSKNSLKRQRHSYVVSNHDCSSNYDNRDDYAGKTMKYEQSMRSLGHNCRRHGGKRNYFLLCAMGDLQSSRNPCPPYSSHKISRDHKRRLYLHGVLGPFVFLFFVRYVSGETQYHDNYSFENTRGIRYKSWDGEGHQGNHEFFNSVRGRDVEYGGENGTNHQAEQLSSTVVEKRRVLQSGERLEDLIQTQRSQSIKENLPPSLRKGDDDSESSSRNEPANEINVSSMPLEYGETFKKGNILIQNKQAVDFDVQILVEDTMTNELLVDLEVFLEKYIEEEYKKFIEGGGGDETRQTNNIANSDLETVKLGKVDLTLQLLESERWEGQQRRQLDTDLSFSMRGSLQSRQRSLQEDQQSSNAKLMTISVDGSVNYSIEVDGSLPTPDEVEEQWDEVYHEIISQKQLQRAIEEADIEGVLRIEDVTPEEDPVDQTDNAVSDVDGINFEQGAANELDSLSQNNTEEVDQDLSDAADNDADTKADSKKYRWRPPDLQRPSLLSIIFGFILTGIAVLGLLVYACIYCRKRKKRLAKKKKMKESITFSSTNAAAAAAAAASTAAASTPNSNLNSQYPSKRKLQSASHPVQTAYPSQVQMPSMMLSQSESADTSYKGIESSVGSEDIADSFANELRLAASRDQQAWDEFQRRKETFEKRETTRSDPVNPPVAQHLQSSFRPVVPSLSSIGLKRSEERERSTGAIESDSDGTPSFMGSFPYGDESRRNRGNGYGANDQLSMSTPWEPYSSSLSLTEEKKDEASATDFFSKKLSDIEKDLAGPGSQTISPHHSRSMETKSTDDVSNSDILSEVSELSKYVRRYERRKDRKIKREGYLHDRISLSERAPPQPLSPNTMSIGMDGRVYNPRNTNQSTQSPSSSPIGLHPAPLSSYAESYISQKQDEVGENSLSFVSDDENEPEDRSITNSKRLGISPFRVSKEEVRYSNEDDSFSGRSPTTSSRTRLSRTQNNDYRYTVGYGHGQDNSKSSSSRLANLRANEAIIDNSNSEVNLNVDEKMPIPGVKNTAAVVSGAAPEPRSNRAETSKTNRFDKIRGLFEQKSNNQTAPPYPPGEHWQYGASRGKQ
mmetsp:Transcript_4011/g.11442  ORF Transcript_4011/g.11442 Transcript_4011/m.11442 type:complete len:1077 (+) Transcript_4011:103-3333(+)